MGNLRVTNEEIKEWADLPVTRLWFRDLITEVARWKSVAATSYKRGKMEESYGVQAEATGAMLCLLNLLDKEIDILDDDGNIIGGEKIFKQDDRKELGYD